MTIIRVFLKKIKKIKASSLKMYRVHKISALHQPSFYGLLRPLFTYIWLVL